VRGQRVEQGEQKRDGNNLRHQQFGQRHHVILGHIGNGELLFQEIFQVENQVEGNVKNQEAAQTIAQRHQQFTQQVAVQQTHRGDHRSGIGVLRG
jgi:hypothetical protein